MAKSQSEIRAAQVYRAAQEKSSEVQNSNQVKLLQFRNKELEAENKLLKKLLKEK